MGSSIAGAFVASPPARIGDMALTWIQHQCYRGGNEVYLDGVNSSTIFPTSRACPPRLLLALQSLHLRFFMSLRTRSVCAAEMALEDSQPAFVGKEKGLLTVRLFLVAYDLLQ